MMTKSAKPIKPSSGKSKPTKSLGKKGADHGKRGASGEQGSQFGSHGGLTCASPPMSSSGKHGPKLWFQAEIIGMMYAFGDNRKPSPQSAALVEDIVHQQMSSLLVQAAEVTNMRGGRFISIDDILFLMRRNKEKLRRVIRYLAFKDLKSKNVKLNSQEEEESSETIGEQKSDNKRLKLAFDFISSIDNTGELVALFNKDGYVDEVKQERLEKAERLSKSLDHQAYVEYTEARQANFNKKVGKFKDWLDVNTLIDVKPSGAVVEILSYLAYETVGQIVDLALLVKEDQERIDLVSSVTPSSLNEQSELVKTLLTPTNDQSSSNGTKGNSLETPSSSSSSSGATTSSTSLISPVQGGLASSLGTASLASSGLIKAPKAKKKKTKGSPFGLDLVSSAIQPYHIREAIRRYCQPVGPLTPFSVLLALLKQRPHVPLIALLSKCNISAQKLEMHERALYDSPTGATGKPAEISMTIDDLSYSVLPRSITSSSM